MGKPLKIKTTGGGTWVALQEIPDTELTHIVHQVLLEFASSTSGTGTLSGLSRGSDNTTAASHSDGATVTDASEYTKWGASQTGDIITAPGLWTLDNFGNKLIANSIYDEIKLLYSTINH